MIRKSEQEDMRRIVDIWLDASLMAHDFIPESYWREKVEVMKSLYLPRAVTFVYEEESTPGIQGFVSMLDSHIEALFVAPEHQGKGVGGKLMEYVKTLSPRWTVNVYSENSRAVNFYFSQGFIVTGEEYDENTGHRELTMEYRCFR